MTIGPGGCGRSIRQSARTPVDSVAWKVTTSGGSARVTISRSWISPNAPRVCLLDRMSCSPSTSPDSFSMLVCARSMVSSRCCSSPSDRAVRSALSPRLSPIALVTSASRASIACARRSCAAACASATWLMPPCNCCCPSFSARTAPSRSRRCRASGSTARPARAALRQQDQEEQQPDRRRPEPRIAGQDREPGRSSPPEQPLDVGELQLDIGRAARGCTGPNAASPPSRAAARSSPPPASAARRAPSRGRPCWRAPRRSAPPALAPRRLASASATSREEPRRRRPRRAGPASRAGRSRGPRTARAPGPAAPAPPPPRASRAHRRRVELHDLRDQQHLARHRRLGARRLQPLVDQPLVRRVLVDDHHAVARSAPRYSSRAAAPAPRPSGSSDLLRLRLRRRLDPRRPAVLDQRRREARRPARYGGPSAADRRRRGRARNAAEHRRRRSCSTPRCPASASACAERADDQAAHQPRIAEPHLGLGRMHVHVHRLGIAGRATAPPPGAGRAPSGRHRPRAARRAAACRAPAGRSRRDTAPPPRRARRSAAPRSPPSASALALGVDPGARWRGTPPRSAPGAARRGRRRDRPSPRPAPGSRAGIPGRSGRSARRRRPARSSPAAARPRRSPAPRRGRLRRNFSRAGVALNRPLDLDHRAARQRRRPRRARGRRPAR